MTEEPNLGGRPPRNLSDKEFEQVRGMVRIQCTKVEICDIMQMDEKTLTKCLKERGEDGFSEFYEKHQGEGKASLRRAQWKSATEDHNPTMLIWLGKQNLDQRDKRDLDLSNTDGSLTQLTDAQLNARIAALEESLENNGEG